MRLIDLYPVLDHLHSIAVIDRKTDKYLFVGLPVQIPFGLINCEIYNIIGCRIYINVEEG